MIIRGNGGASRFVAGSIAAAATSWALFVPPVMADPGQGHGQGQGQGQGQGTDNQSEVPYTNVFQDFYDFAITSLDRSYVPLDVKDYVRDYFSSLNPTQQ